MAPQLKRHPLGAPLVSLTGLPTASLRLLFATVVVCTVFVFVYGFLGIPLHPFIHLVIVIAPLVAAISWLKADARVRHVPLVHDMGLFLWVAWPVLIPWYAVKTRGRHGLPLALVVGFAIITPLVLAAVFETARALRWR
jgi:hypothetical protein